ncbi:hypothetical protein GYMLUDRAFT_240824 [Collybiopsis luxurians FD-317 M1]|nr:hypothetical protein GYMLUDRAFT_240824 [Collybiopsis luxurians FD-317 M1]
MQLWTLSRTIIAIVLLIGEAKEDDDEEEYGLPDGLAWGEKEDNAYDEHLAKELHQYASTDLSLSGSAGSSCMMKDANGFWIPSLFDDIEAQYIHLHGPGYHKIASPTPPPLTPSETAIEDITICPNLVYPLSPTLEIPFEFPKVLGKAIAEQEDEEEQEGEEKEEEEEKDKEEEEEEGYFFEVELETDLDPTLAAFYEQL